MKTTMIMCRSLAGLALLGMLLVSMLVGCKETPPPSLYDPNAPVNPAPTIASVTPPSVALAGVDTIVITGTNFSSSLTDNLVFFNNVLATVFSASPTQLMLKAPVLVDDSIAIKIAVTGATAFSNPVLYKLDAAVSEFGGFASFEEPYGIACDTAGNVYASLLSGGVGAGVKKYTPAGVRSDLSPQFSSSVNKWSGMKVGPGGFLYTVARNIVFRVPLAGGSAAPWTSNILPSPGIALDLDFDALGNVWVGGTGTVVISRARVSDKNVKTFPFTGTVRSVRVFDGYLYLGGRVDTTEGVWRLKIVDSDNLGPVELYYKYANNTPGVYAITFSSGGDMYVGTDGPEGVTVVHPDKRTEALYPGLLSPQSLTFAWGKTTELYLSRSGTATHLIVKINTRKTSAPYYGLQ